MARGPPDEHSRLLAARVRGRAKALDILITHVPDLAGVSASHFWAVLNGNKKPTVSWLMKVAEALRCDVTDLLAGPVPKLPSPPRLRESQRVPLMSVRAAAGAFLESSHVESSGWVGVPPGRKVEDGMFAAAVSGRSMEPLIGDGAIGLFRPVEGLDLDGRVLLLQLRDARDPETGGRYTVKRFEVVDRDPRGRVLRVRLVPENQEYEAMVLEEDPMRQLAPIAEFLEVLVPAPG